MNSRLGISNHARVGFQGERGAYSEEAAVCLLGESVESVPCATFDAAFRLIAEGGAEALLVPVENSLAGSVVRVYDLLVQSKLSIVAEVIHPIEHHLIGCPGAKFDEIHSVASHPMALAQCERFFAANPRLLRVAAEDTAGSVREVLARGDKTAAAIAGRRAAELYHGDILQSEIQDDRENFTRFVLLVRTPAVNPAANKMTIAMRLAHRPGSLAAALEPFARCGVNLSRIESRPIHGRPWEYQFFLDMEAEEASRLQAALAELYGCAVDVRVLGCYRRANKSRESSER
jgi:prephenate dehydratase